MQVTHIVRGLLGQAVRFGVLMLLSTGIAISGVAIGLAAELVAEQDISGDYRVFAENDEVQLDLDDDTTAADAVASHTPGGSGAIRAWEKRSGSRFLDLERERGPPNHLIHDRVGSAGALIHAPK